jgi:hypothetical protein
MGGARMTPSSTPDLSVLRKAFLILASAPVKSTTIVSPLLEVIGKSIKEQNKSAA